MGKFGTKFRTKRLGLIILGLVLFTQTVSAEYLSLPIRLQTALFVKIFKYNHTLKNKNSIRVLIVFDREKESVKKELVSSMQKLSLEVVAVEPGELEKCIADYDVVYFMLGQQRLGQLCKEHKVLSISGTPKDTEEGNVSLAVGVYMDKPKIFLNLTSLQAEGNDISAELLKLAKIYK